MGNPVALSSERIEAERVKFEAWITASPYSFPVERYPLSVQESFPGMYVDPVVQVAWHSWLEGSRPTGVNVDAKWLDPECLDGCKSLVFKNELRIALRESVKLQAHYAGLLNQWDGGQRMIFPDVEAWMARLREKKTLPERKV